MTDPRLKKLAEILVHYSCTIKKGDKVVIASDLVGEPLVQEVFAETIRAGGNPIVSYSTGAMMETFYKEASQEQLEWISPTTLYMFEDADAFFSLRASDNSRVLSNVDPEKQALAAKARTDIRKIYKERSASGALRWVIAQFPCQAHAQDADMSLTDYEDFVYSACFAGHDDPVGEWNKLHAMQETLINWLKGKKEITLKSSNADLRLSIDGRSFINSAGKNNMPSGEIFTSPVEDSINGWVNFSYPAVRVGREVNGIRLEIKDGKVQKASATKNEEYLLSQLAVDEGASYFGEWAIGTNYGIKQFTKNILFDEKIGGSFHMAVGSGFSEAGGKNDSAIHWDMICDIQKDSEIRVDGDLFYKDGQFQI
ncbi:MAG: aminopeptidase [Anaerolineae bacterium]|nr:aminopeptidase [Anaerolineae bacterium]